MANLFYKMPADILQQECIQKMLNESGALSQFGLTILMWLMIQEARNNSMKRSVLMNMFRSISSESQRKKVLESGFFYVDESEEIVKLQHSRVHACGHAPEHAPEHAAGHTPGHAAEHTPVPIFEELDIELDIEGDLKRTNPTQGEIWEGVLLCCPDQSLRRLMQENWPLTVDFMVQHLKSSGKMAEVKDWKGLCDTLREMVQPAHPAFGGLKLWLEQVPKSDTERAFDSWISKQTNILQMQQPLTYQQFRDLVQLGFEATHVRSTIERLNNYPSTPTRYVSAFQTAKDWLQNPLR